MNGKGGIEGEKKKWSNNGFISGNNYYFNYSSRSEY